jgi:amidohydrolase family protein
MEGRAMVKRLSRLAPFLALTGLGASAAHGQQPALVIRHVNVIPMNRDVVLRGRTVLIRDGRIAAIDTTPATPVPAAESVDGTGLFLIPGLIDSHVHLYNPHQLELFLAHGVTTVFNLNGQPLHLAWRDEVARGARLGPRIFTAAPKFARADVPDRAVALVESYAKQGYDAIKIYDQVSKAEYPALIRAAKEHHLLIVGHVAREPGFELAVSSGQAIAHAEEYLYTYFKQHGNGTDADLALIPQAVALTKASGVPVMTTFATYSHILEMATDSQAFFRRPELADWSPWELEDLKNPSENPYLGADSSDIAALRHGYPFLKVLVKQLHDAGVPILAGTDAGWMTAMPGVSLHEELLDLVDAGLTPYEALRSATADPARYLRVDKERGTIEAGKAADLVLLSANPIADIGNTRRIVGVVERGRWFSREALDSLVAALPEKYAGDERSVEELLANAPQRAAAELKATDPFFELGTAVVRAVALREGEAAFARMIRAAREADADTPFDTPDLLNDVADYLMGKHRSDDALALGQFNVTEHPESAIASDRLGRSYYRLGQLEPALRYYRRALQVDSAYWNAEFARKRVADLARRVAAPQP